MLHRVDIDSEDIESVLISKLPECDKDDNFVDDVDETNSLEDTLVDYVNSDKDIQNIPDDDDDDNFDVWFEMSNACLGNLILIFYFDYDYAFISIGFF